MNSRGVEKRGPNKNKGPLSDRTIVASRETELAVGVSNTFKERIQNVVKTTLP